MPDWRAEIRARLRPADLAPEHEADLVEELAQHLELQFADLSGRIGSDDATRTILSQLGDLRLVGEVLRPHGEAVAPAGAATAGRGWLADVWQDHRYGARALRRAPAFTTVAVLSLALGIGATTAIFGLMHTVLLERLDVRRPQELVQLQRSTIGLYDKFGYDDYLALKAAGSLTALEATISKDVAVVIGDARWYPNAELVSGGFFGMVGVRPLMGRVITEADDRGGSAVAVVSEDFWRRQLGGDHNALGRRITIDDNPFTVIGVLPRSYRGLVFGGTFTLAVPLSASRQLGVADARSPNRPALVALFGRMAPGQNVIPAGAIVDAAFQRCCGLVQLPAPPPSKGGGRGGTVPGTEWKRGTAHVVLMDASRGAASPNVDLRGQYSRILTALMAGVVVLLLIACANVGNLLLARGSTRAREIAVRMSMGASRWRLVRQLLTESLQLAVAGAVVGLALARLSTSLLSKNLPPAMANLSGVVALRPNAAILSCAVAATLGATLLFGLLPTLRATKADVMTPLKGGSRFGGGRRTTLDRGLVASQVALALVLVCCAALFVRTLRNLKQFDSGAGALDVLVAELDTRGTTEGARGMTRLYPALLESATQLPGVSSAAMSTIVPLFGGEPARDFVRASGFVAREDDDYMSRFAAVSPGYFTTMRISLVRGRAFVDGDRAGSEPVVIVSEAFARHYFAGRDPLGSTLGIGAEGGGRNAPVARVVGVARNVKYDDLRAPTTMLYYVPLAQAADLPKLSLSIHTSGQSRDPAALRQKIEAIAPGIRIGRLEGMSQALDHALARERLAAALGALFGVSALGLAAVGLYGVVTYGVARRTREIGMRMALGARPLDALWLVGRQALVMTAVGIAAGIPLTLAASSGLRAELYGLDAHDPAVFMGAAALLLLVGIVAALVPAMRAARLDPVEALRAE